VSRTVICQDALDTVAGIADGSTVLIGGFGTAGLPTTLIDALIEQGATDLTVVSNNAGNADTGLAALLAAGRVRKVICSFPRQTDSYVFDELYRTGKVALEVVPQGNLAERIRAAGAGIGAFFCPTAVGTPLADGRETRSIDGRDYVLEYPIRGDVALIRAHVGDRAGNLTYHRTARNFGPVMAAAAERTIAEVSRVVDAGGIDPETVVTPGIFVDRILDLSAAGQRQPAHPTDVMTSPYGPNLAHTAVEHLDRGPLDRHELAAIIARDIPPGSYVNLGIGQPTLVAEYLRPEAGVVLQTENGMLGMGGAARGADVDEDLINAGKVPVTETPGASYFHHADSFAMMRGGHLDVCVLGAFQVSENGDLANWHTGAPDAIPAVGGAMDLAIGAKRVFVMMDLFAKDGQAKLVPSCSYPLTGQRCVDRVYTEQAIFQLDPAGGQPPRVLETFGTTVAELVSRLQIQLRSEAGQHA
jgi:3-oxoadipate CoA-transferase alpha subunit